MTADDRAVAEFLDRLRNTVGAKHACVLWGDLNNDRFQWLGLTPLAAAALLERIAWQIRSGNLSCSEQYIPNAPYLPHSDTHSVAAGILPATPYAGLLSAKASGDGES